MPYTHKKVGSKYVVYKKGKKVGETEGTKTALNKYLAALHIADKKESIEEAVKKQAVNEAETGLANNFTFWVVEKSKSLSDNPQDLFFETDPIGFANQLRGDLMPQDILGFYLSEDEASEAAHDEVVAVFEAAKSLEEKKMTVTEKIEKTIARLQKEVTRCMKEGDEESAQKHLQRISELKHKSKMVEASKRPLEELSYEKSGLKNPKKADLDKNKDISDYEQKRGKAVEKSTKTKK